MGVTESWARPSNWVTPAELSTFFSVYILVTWFILGGHDAPPKWIEIGSQGAKQKPYSFHLQSTNTLITHQQIYCIPLALNFTRVGIAHLKSSDKKIRRKRTFPLFLSNYEPRVSDSPCDYSPRSFCVYMHTHAHTHTHTHTHCSYISCCIVAPLLYRRPLLVIWFIYSSVCMLTPLHLTLIILLWLGLASVLRTGLYLYFLILPHDLILKTFLLSTELDFMTTTSWVLT